MIQKVTLPKLGETVEVSTIERWRKKEGDTIRTGDVLCEITTDKATLEVESYVHGTLLKILEPAGKELPVGAPIALVGDPGDAIPDDLQAQATRASASAPKTPKPSASPAPAAPAVAPAAEPTGRTVASPRAKRLAKELGVALESVRGTGPGGRIVEADIQAAAQGAAPAAAAASSVKARPLARKAAAAQGVDLATVQGTGVGGKVMKDDVAQAATAPVHQTAPSAPAATAPGAPGEVVPLSAMRRIVADRMLLSKQTIPCYYLTMDVDVTDLVCLRNKLNVRGGQKITFNDFVLKACGVALRLFPVANSRWVEGGIERRREAHVGFAVALDDGLIVPVVRDVDRKPLQQISAESADLTERARTKRLLPPEYRDGCMTVSNLGMYGIKHFVPVVNPGEATILGLGMVEERLVVRQGGMHIRKIMTLTLAADHRIVDGAVGAQFLEAIRDALEAPQRLAQP